MEAVAEDPLWRRELDGYVRRHEADEYAHAAMRHDLRNDLVGTMISSERRIAALERWQQRIIGAVGMLTFLVTAGVIAGVIELLRR